MKLTTTLKQVTFSELMVEGESLGMFRTVSEWNGMTELRNQKGEKIIIRTSLAFEEIFNALFPVMGREQTVSIVRADGSVGRRLAGIIEAKKHLDEMIRMSQNFSPRFSEYEVEDYQESDLRGVEPIEGTRDALASLSIRKGGQS